MLSVSLLSELQFTETIRGVGEGLVKGLMEMAGWRKRNAVRRFEGFGGEREVGLCRILMGLMVDMTGDGI